MDDCLLLKGMHIVSVVYVWCGSSLLGKIWRALCTNHEHCSDGSSYARAHCGLQVKAQSLCSIHSQEVPVLYKIVKTSDSPNSRYLKTFRLSHRWIPCTSSTRRQNTLYDGEYALAIGSSYCSKEEGWKLVGAILARGILEDTMLTVIAFSYVDDYY
jgi:hypothetical protein